MILLLLASPTAVRFGATRTEAAPLRATSADVNDDGLSDLFLHFAIPDAGIASGGTTAVLTEIARRKPQGFTPGG